MIAGLEGKFRCRNCHALDRRDWRIKSADRSFTTAKPQAPINWTKIGVLLPFLWFSGFFAGIATILWLKGL